MGSSNKIPKTSKAPATISKPPGNETTSPQDNTPNFKLIFDNDIDLLDLDEYHNQMLVDFLNKNESQLVPLTTTTPTITPVNTNPVTQTIHNVSHNGVSKPSNIPILPKMFFPNSNITINYNFGK